MSIQNVVKRNGTVEKFDINKILRWELWGCYDIKQFIDWKDIIIKVKSKLHEGMSTQDVQLTLIEECNLRQTWYHSLLAGRLYTAYITKKIYPNGHPTIKELHDKMVHKGLMVRLDYTDEEYEYLETVINHNKDFNLSYIQIGQLTRKYTLSDRVSGESFETPQFIFMRMAMALAEDEREDRIRKVVDFYDVCLSEFKMNAPTPNYVNLGTRLKGYISCCLYTTADEAESIAIGDYIANTMTYMSAGIGGFLNTRSLGEPVKNGMTKHLGKLPLFKSVGGSISAMSQNSRGGSDNQYFSAYDPEALDIIMLQNPRTPLNRQNRDNHYTMMHNDFLIEKAFKNEEVFAFNTFSAPDLTEAIFKGDGTEFRELYTKYENDPNFKKKYTNALNLMLNAYRQSHEVATLYHFNASEVNRHTPFKEPIYQSNLCNEIVQPTKPYTKMQDLYSTELHERGEISLCALGGIVPSFIKDDEEYEKVAYHTLLMIDKCIHTNHYVFPHLELTAKARMNAGVGLVGVAHELARKNLKYNSKEGLEYLHFLAERHAYFLIKAALKLGKEKGNAPWMHKTKWPEGWLPIDTYNKNIDEVGDFKLHYDWETLRQEIIENGGIRFSCLIAHMPTESSSKSTGLPNSVYPVRALYLKKTDGSNALDFLARDSDIIGDQYQLAWDLSPEDQAKFYGVIQKFTDQSISADVYSDRRENISLKASRLMDEIFYFYKYGVKTRYYTNSKTVEGNKLDNLDERGCSGGACTL